MTSLNDSVQRSRELINVSNSPTPLQQKSPAMYYPGHLSQQGTTTPGVPDNGLMDYKDILDEKLGSPRIMVKQSQPLLSKNHIMSYLNE